MEEKVFDKAVAHKEISEIKEVSEGKEFYGITKIDGWCFGISKKYRIIPKVGDEVTIYGEPFQRIQGVDINGKEVFFKTEAEMEQERQNFVKAFHEEQMKKYEETMEKIKNDESFETVDISGMGGSYEWGCQMMLQAGIKILKEQHDFHFDYQGFKNVYGLVWTDTPWGKELDKALSDAVNHSETGAMHQAVIGHLQYIHSYSYDKWLKKVSAITQIYIPT